LCFRSNVKWNDDSRVKLLDHVPFQRWYLAIFVAISTPQNAFTSWLTTRSVTALMLSESPWRMEVRERFQETRGSSSEMEATLIKSYNHKDNTKFNQTWRNGSHRRRLAQVINLGTSTRAPPYFAPLQLRALGLLMTIVDNFFVPKSACSSRPGCICARWEDRISYSDCFWFSSDDLRAAED